MREVSVKDESFTHKFVPAAQNLQAVRKGMVMYEKEISFPKTYTHYGIFTLTYD